MTDEAQEVATPPGEVQPGDQPGSTPGDEKQLAAGTPPDGDAAGEAGASADDDAGAPRKKGVERRIGKLTRRWRQSERDNAALRQEMDALKERVGPAPEPPRPNSSDFETTEDYEDALLEWHDAKRAPSGTPPETTDSTATPTQDGSADDVINAFEDELEALAPDAVLTVMDDEWPCSQAMTDFIMDSDKRAQLAYHLASNTELAEKISALPPVAAARELVKIEAELPAPTTSTPTPAPPPPPGTPVTPVAGAVTVDDDKLSTKQWREKRERELAASHG